MPHFHIQQLFQLLPDTHTTQLHKPQIFMVIISVTVRSTSKITNWIADADSLYISHLTASLLFIINAINVAGKQNNNTRGAPGLPRLNRHFEIRWKKNKYLLSIISVLHIKKPTETETNQNEWLNKNVSALLATLGCGFAFNSTTFSPIIHIRRYL